MFSNNVSINSSLLLVLSSMLFLPILLTSKTDFFTYASSAAAIVLLINTMLAYSFRLNKYSVFMIVAFLLHLFFTPDKFTTVLFMVTNLFLFEVLKQYDFSYKYVIYPFLAFTFVSFIVTIPQFFNVLHVGQLNRSLLYEGLTTNANSNSTLYLLTIMSSLLFIRTPYLRKILIGISLLCIIASGSRNGILSLFTAIWFYYVLNSKFRKWTLCSFFVLLFMFTVYLVFIEATKTVDFAYMGKGGDSAGRSQQVIYIINHYSVNLFGYGKNIINMATVKLQGYAVHNFWVSSLYSSGLLIMGGYIYFICNLFNRLKSDVAKSFLLSFNLHFFFEPGLCYYISFSNIFPIIVVLLKYNEEKMQIELGENDKYCDYGYN